MLIVRPLPSSMRARPSSTATSAPTRHAVAAMLDRLGYASLEELMTAAVPEQIRSDRAPRSAAAAPARRPPPASCGRWPRDNRPGEAMIGLGYHATLTPAVIRRNLLEDPAWYTAYTPYQPEISQGRLEALLNFQTVVADLTGLPVSGASLLDEGTAAAEALALVHRANRKASGPFVIDADALPQTIDVMRTRAAALGLELLVADLDARACRRATSPACSCSTPARPAGSWIHGR